MAICSHPIFFDRQARRASLHEMNLRLDDIARNLPAYGIADEVNRSLAANPRLVVTAPPGAGKSTLLPLTMLEGTNGGGKILMLEPDY